MGLPAEEEDHCVISVHLLGDCLSLTHIRSSHGESKQNKPDRKFLAGLPVVCLLIVYSLWSVLLHEVPRPGTMSAFCMGNHPREVSFLLRGVVMGLNI